jgi:quercetin dioxygenase-like cupin family protein
VETNVSVRSRRGRIPQDEIVIRSADISTYEPTPGPKSRLLTGEDHGLGLCLGISEYPPGAETPSHRHPNASAIVVVEGRGRFTVGENEAAAETSDVVIVPANAWHSFRNDRDGWLRLVGADEGARHDAELAEPSAT